MASSSVLGNFLFWIHTSKNVINGQKTLEGFKAKKHREAIPGKEPHLIQLNKCCQSPSGLKIATGRDYATPQQQESKSGYQEYPVYHQREEKCQASQGLRTGRQLTLAQADRHQARKASILSEAHPAMSSDVCNPINSNQPAHNGDYFKTNGGFKPSGFG